MEILSVTFIGFSALSVLLVRSFDGSPLRPWILLALNLLFVLSFAPDDPAQLIPLAGFLALAWGGTRLLHRYRSVAATVATISVTVAVFILLKRYHQQWFPDSALAQSIQVHGITYIEVGLSYILFRVLQIMIDTVQSGMQHAVSPIKFVNFTMFFPAFISGPVQRYQDFTAQAETPEAIPDRSEIVAIFWRIFWGVVKVSAISALLWYYMDSRAYGRNISTLHGDFLLAARWYMTNCVVFTLFVYFNFSGYTDIVIGVARLLGFRLPENFNRPYLATNYLDFWARWHMSVSNWFRVYVFNNVVAGLSRNWMSPRMAPYFGVIGFFVTFFLVGIWHVPTLKLGIALALGTSVNMLYMVQMRRRLGAKRYKELCARPWYRHAARGLAIGYFAVSITAMWIDIPTIANLFGRRGHYLVMAGSVICLSALFAFCSVCVEAAVGRFGGWAKRTDIPWWVQGVGIGAASMLLLIVLMVANNQAPTFLYKGF